jgi:para-aminobenzoate synthetase/4-amino-4-deoxychorismate lyase
MKIALSPHPVNSENPFLCHKTTFREVYEQARAACPEADEVLLINERGELTEGTFTNLMLEKDGALLTPAATSGLLPGTLRAAWLENGSLREARLYPSDLESADRIWLINSVRGRIPAENQRAD